jgi:lipopolysaccharide/colanic/teichoic acid biosynthesis glycosyltransferase
MKKTDKSFNTSLFWINKRIFDVSVSIALLPLLIFISLILLVANIFFNRGSLFYAIKFRSMKSVGEITREYNDPLETYRITPLGRILRKSRIDELPQIINVLKGEMSLIGPRPDYYEHAIVFLENVKGYRERHTIRPGISGLSQIRLGYAEGLEATSKKVIVDNYYINNIGYTIELKIIINTVITIIKGLGI